MALTDPFIGILFFQVVIYFMFFENKLVWKRLVGSVGIMLMGMGYAYVGDTTLMGIFSVISMLIGGIRIIETVTELTKRG